MGHEFPMKHYIMETYHILNVIPIITAIIYFTPFLGPLLHVVF